MTQDQLYDTDMKRVEILRSDDGSHEVLVNGRKVEGCTGVSLTLSFGDGYLQWKVGKDGGPPAGPPRPHLRGGT